MTRIPLAPMPKPRMTRADRWKKRPVIERYWAWCADLRRLWGDRPFPEAGATLIFRVPMPASWSKKKRAAMDGQPHRQRPDVDNYAKAVLDALHTDDSGVWDLRVVKRWAVDGAIELHEWAPSEVP